VCENRKKSSGYEKKTYSRKSESTKAAATKATRSSSRTSKPLRTGGRTIPKFVGRGPADGYPSSPAADYDPVYDFHTDYDEYDEDLVLAEEGDAEGDPVEGGSDIVDVNAKEEGSGVEKEEHAAEPETPVNEEPVVMQMPIV
jgi:hypothetical protein